MGRRLVGGVLVGIGLIAASFAWTGFSLTRTIFDPNRSVAVADALLDDREVRDQLRSSLATSLSAAIPAELEVNRADLIAAAERALDDPRVEDAIANGLVRAHQRFLGLDPRPDEPIVIDAAVLGDAARSGLIATRPELLTVLPEISSAPVALPVDRLPDGGGARVWLDRSVVLLAALAVGLIAAAFVLTNDRARILRRVGYWAIGAGAFWLVIGVVLPQLAHLLVPGQAAVFAAIWGVAAEGMIPPSTVAAAAGAGAVVLGFVWSGVNALLRRSGRASAPQDARARPPATSSTRGPAPMVAAASSPMAPPPQPAHSSSAWDAPTDDRTQVATPFPGADPTGASPTRPRPSAAPQWVEGVGYVDDDDATRFG
ncbi:MAG: hypothetical protein ACXIVQ_11770 [Acidimicrobiales bacterium]